MVKNVLFALLSAACTSVFVQAAQPNDVVAPATLHQEQILEGMEALEGNQAPQEPKSSQEAAGHPAVTSPHQAEALDEIGMRFQKLDQDQNGQISREEAKAEVDLAEQWTALDNNGDGTLSPTEYAGRTIPSDQAR